MAENALIFVIHSFLATTVGITAINTAARMNVLQAFLWAWTFFALRISTDNRASSELSIDVEKPTYRYLTNPHISNV